MVVIAPKFTKGSKAIYRPMHFHSKRAGKIVVVSVVSEDFIWAYFEDDDQRRDHLFNIEDLAVIDDRPRKVTKYYPMVTITSDFKVLITDIHRGEEYVCYYRGDSFADALQYANYIEVRTR